MCKKVAFYINAINGGGAERVMVNLAGQFAEHGYDTILITSFRDDWEYELSPLVKRISLEQKEIKQSQIMRNYTRIKKLRKICKDEKPDVLISFMGEPNFRSVLATVGLSMKTIISVRNDPEKEYAGFIRGLVGKYLLPFADGCVFQTEDAKVWFPKRLQDKSTIIMNPVKEEFFRIKRNPVPGLIVTCGRLVPQKNHKLLIKAFAKVVERIDYARLEIYGEGPLKQELQNLINSLELQNKVKLMGATKDVPAVLAKADLFVLSSDYEGMPNALMEAMVAGVPCISTDCPCGGPRMLIKDGENGLLVPVGDVDKLEKYMVNVLLHRDYAKLLGKKAHEISTYLAPEMIYEQWEKYLETMVTSVHKSFVRTEYRYSPK